MGTGSNISQLESTSQPQPTRGLALRVMCKTSLAYYVLCTFLWMS